MLGLKLIRVSKRGSWTNRNILRKERRKLLSSVNAFEEIQIYMILFCNILQLRHKTGSWNHSTTWTPNPVAQSARYVKITCVIVWKTRMQICQTKYLCGLICILWPAHNYVQHAVCVSNHKNMHDSQYHRVITILQCTIHGHQHATAITWCTLHIVWSHFF